MPIVYLWMMNMITTLRISEVGLPTILLLRLLTVQPNVFVEVEGRVHEERLELCVLAVHQVLGHLGCEYLLHGRDLLDLEAMRYGATYISK